MRVQEHGERVYGFDLRTGLGSDDPAWDTERRQRFLLRPDVRRPVSVDPAVWPRSVPVARAASWCDAPYWWSEAEARRAASAEGISPVVAVLIAMSATPPELGNRLFGNPGTHPMVGWALLGFDVAAGSLSGLSNCGWLWPEHKPARRSNHKNATNEFGLFDDRRVASRYAAFVGKRAASDGPFFVHGIYTIPW